MLSQDFPNLFGGFHNEVLLYESLMFKRVAHTTGLGRGNPEFPFVRRAWTSRLKKVEHTGL
jgi:hypothetical protein